MMTTITLYRADGIEPVVISRAEAIRWVRRTREALRGFESAIQQGDVEAMVDWAHEASGSAAELENIADTTRDESARVMCEWFALCDREAIGLAPHPVLGRVPVCGRCAEKAEIDLPTLTPIEGK